MLKRTRCIIINGRDVSRPYNSQIDEDPKNGFTMIDIRIKNSQVFHRLKDFFTFDKIIAFEDWIYTLADIDKMIAVKYL